jgi:predicted NBD/HSP70 family sugar kinase
MEINTKTKAGLISIVRVLHRLWISGPASRATLARELELDKSTLTKVCGRLVDAGIIHRMYEGRVSSKGGRRPSLLEINPKKGSVAGIEIQPDRVTICYTDLRGRLLAENAWDIQPEERSIQTILARTSEGFRPAVEGVPVIGAGIGIPGIIDTADGTILRSTPLHIDSLYPLAQEMEKLFKLPVVCDNDANCCAWGGLFGIPELAGKSSFTALLGDQRSTGLSTGFSFVLGNEEVYHGRAYSAGEFRSVYCPEGGDRQFSVQAGIPCSLSGHQAPADTLEELCRNTAFLVNILNLEAVVVAGTLVKDQASFTRKLQQEIRRNWIYPPAPECAVYCAPGGKQAVAFGAAALFLRKLCQVPSLSRTGSGYDGSLLRRVFGTVL